MKPCKYAINARGWGAIALLLLCCIPAASGAGAVRIPAELDNLHPALIIQPIESQRAVVGEEIAFQLNVARHFEGTIEFSTNFSPKGASFDPESLIFSWTPTERDIGTYFGIRFNAVNGKVRDSQAVKINVVDKRNEKKSTRSSSHGEKTSGGTAAGGQPGRTAPQEKQPASGAKETRGQEKTATDAEKPREIEKKIEEERFREEEGEEEKNVETDTDASADEEEDGTLGSGSSSSGGVLIPSSSPSPEPSPAPQPGDSTTPTQEPTIQPTPTPTRQSTVQPTPTPTPTKEASPGHTPTATPAQTPEPWFRDVTSEAGAGGPAADAHDAAFFDYDNDGYPDIYITNGDGILHNEQNGTFSETAFPALSSSMEKVVTGDFDGDGDTDLFLVSLGSPPDCTSMNALMRNDGGGSFTDVTESAGLGYGNGDQRGAVFFDADGDNYNDLFVLSAGSSTLYRGRGNGTFVNITSTLALEDWSDARVVAVLDYDSDGLTDVLALLESRCALYRNEGNLSFTDVASAAGLDGVLLGRAAAVGDYDNDGDPDIYIVRPGENLLFRNDGGVFVDVTASAGVGDTGDGSDAVWGDLDNDGDLDLYVVNNGPNVLYKRDGESGAFADTDSLSGAADAGDGRAVCVGDYNGDGYLDLYVVNETSPNVLYENGQSGQNWLKVRLEGGDGSCSPIGVKVDVEIDGHSPMSRWSGTRPGGDATISFGLDTAEKVTSLTIEWHDGTTAILTDVGTDQAISLPVPDNALYVNGSVLGSGSGTKEDPYPLIQDAIDAATDGDIIKIATGAYNEHLFVDPGIRLYGGYEGTTWDRVDVTATQTTVTGTDPLDYSIDLSERCVLDYITVSGFNGVYCGGETGIAIVDGAISVTNVGIYTRFSGDPHILANVIYDNTTNNGIEVWENASPTIYGNLIGSHGISSGIRCGDSSTPAIINNTIVDNDWRGIHVEGDSDPAIVNNIVTGNGVAGIRWSNSITVPDEFQYNDVWNNTANYDGMGDPTGTEGNISEDPQYLDPAALDYGLPLTSPAAAGGLGGYFMGAFAPEP